MNYKLHKYLTIIMYIRQAMKADKTYDTKGRNRPKIL